MLAGTKDFQRLQELLKDVLFSAVAGLAGEIGGCTGKTASDWLGTMFRFLKLPVSFPEELSRPELALCIGDKLKMLQGMLAG